MTQMKVELIDSMGDDLRVVNAARASFGRKSEHNPDGSLKEADASLIRFLAHGRTAADRAKLRDEIVACRTPDQADELVKRIRRTKTHEQPFAQVEIVLHMRAPLAIARQLWKSHIGSVGGDAGYAAWSEESGRYIGDARECYIPSEWRSKASNVKQGSGGPIEDQTQAWRAACHVHNQSEIVFDEMVDKLGVAPEQARFVLPQSMMVTWVWKGSLLFFARVCQLRMDEHAQKETQEIAGMISNICATIAPESWEALVG